MIIAELIQAWRVHHHITVREASRRIGISEGTLLRIETGKPMSLTTFLTIVYWLTEADDQATLQPAVTPVEPDSAHQDNIPDTEITT